MIKAFLKFIESENLFGEKDKILLAVSGGADSMVMAHLFLAAAIPFSIAHVNYNLRDEDSVSDMEFVNKWAHENGVTAHVREVGGDEYESKDSTQMIARKIRYEFFEELTNEFGYAYAATAHHLDDSLETALLNLVKGTGPLGVRGIQVKNTNVVRPLMFATRSEIRSYAAEQNIKWREDISNTKTDYQRNLIRHKVLTVLKEINPSLSKTFADTATRLSGSVDIINEKKRELLNQYQSKNADVITLATDWIKKDNSSLLLLSEIVSDFGLNFKQTKDIFQCVIQEGKSGKLFYSDKYVINIDRERLLIKPKNELLREEVEVFEVDESLALNNCLLEFAVLEESNQFSTDPKFAFLDFDKVQWPLKIRRWKEADKFVPLGMNGKKMVSDFMIDSKIPVSLKEEIMVLISGGEIAWILGYRISNNFRISESTRRTLKISMSHA